MPHLVQTISEQAFTAAGAPATVKYSTSLIVPNPVLAEVANDLPIVEPDLLGTLVGRGGFACRRGSRGNECRYLRPDGRRDGTGRRRARGAPYYDVAGTHQRDDTSLAIYDAPRVEVSAATPKVVTTATDHLLVRGRVEYTLTWTQTTLFTGAATPPIATYSVGRGAYRCRPAGDPAHRLLGPCRFTDPIIVPNPLASPGQRSYPKEVGMTFSNLFLWLLALLGLGGPPSPSRRRAERQRGSSRRPGLFPR